MPSSNLSLPPKKITRLLIFLSLGLALIASFPLLTPSANPFYSIDPDIPYIANSLQISVRNQSSFINHPGTALQQYLAFFYWPVRIWAKLIAHEPFMVWVISHFELLVWYSRVVMIFNFFVGVLLISIAGFLISRSVLVTFIGLSYILLIPDIFSSAASIRAENFLFMLFSIWALFFILWLNLKRSIFLYANFFSLGLIIGTKITAIFLIPVSLFALLYDITKYQTKNLYRFTNIVNSPFFFISALIGSTWIIRSKYIHFFNWARSLFSHSGLYGGGQESFLVLEDSITNGLSTIKSNPVLFFLTAITGTLILFSKNRARGLFGSIFLIGFVGILVFFKYPLGYYHIANFLLISLALFYFLPMLSRSTHLFLLFLSLVSIIFLAKSTIKTQRELIQESFTIDAFVSSHTPKGPVVWEYARSKDFSLLWGRDWSGDFYAKELAQIYPDLYDLHNYVYLKSPNLKFISTHDLCWNQFYIQKSSYSDFISHNPSYVSFKPQLIPQTQMLFLTNELCN